MLGTTSAGSAPSETHRPSPIQTPGFREHVFRARDAADEQLDTPTGNGRAFDSIRGIPSAKPCAALDQRQLGGGDDQLVRAAERSVTVGEDADPDGLCPRPSTA